MSKAFRSVLIVVLMSATAGAAAQIAPVRRIVPVVMQPAPEPAIHWARMRAVVGGDLFVNDGYVHITHPNAAPELHFHGQFGSWLMGIDVANPPGKQDFVLAAKVDPASRTVNDLLYVSHNGARAPTVGVGVTPPSSRYRLQVSGEDNEPTMGALLLRRSVNQTANLFAAIDSAGAERLNIDSGFWWTGSHPATGSALSIRSNAATGRALAIANSDTSSVFTFENSLGFLDVRYATGGMSNMQLGTNGKVYFPNGIETASLSVRPANVAPSHGASPCTTGAMVYDENYVFICVRTNTWKRAALSGF